MYIQITEEMFIEQFRIMDRMDNFSIDGLKALYEHFEELEDNTGQPIECDVIAICCDFSEDTYKDILSNYDLASFEELAELDDSGEGFEPESLNDEQMELIVERLNEETIVVYHDDEKVLYQNF